MKRLFDDCPVCSPVRDMVKFIRCDVTAYIELSKHPEKPVYQENTYVVTPANFCPCCGRPMTHPLEGKLERLMKHKGR